MSHQSISGMGIIRNELSSGGQTASDGHQALKYSLYERLLGRHTSDWSITKARYLIDAPVNEWKHTADQTGVRRDAFAFCLGGLAVLSVLLHLSRVLFICTYTPLSIA